MSVMTVNGKIDASLLGITAPHEHVLIDTTNFYHEPDAVSDRVFANKKLENMRDLGKLRLNPSGMRDNFVLNDEQLQIQEVVAYQRAGGQTIVDLTLRGIGRDVAFLRRLSNQTGLNVIAGTGFYVVSSHPDYLRDMDEKAIAQIMLSEIENGIDGTDIRPGVIGEIGVGYDFHPQEQKVLRAAAYAHKESGLPLSIHVSPWSVNGMPAMKILQEEGIDPKHICICHSDGECKKDYMYQLLDTGAYLEFDNFGKEFSVLDYRKIRKGIFDKFVSDWQREETLIELINAGYEDQLLISCDVCLKMFLQEYGGFGYAHILENIVPELRMYGVSQAKIDKLLIDNPRLFLDVV